MMALPMVMASFLALTTATPRLICIDEKKPPASPPIAANKKGTHAKATICLMSKSNCSFKKNGNHVTNIHQTGSMKNREVIMPQVFLNCNSCVHEYTFTAAFAVVLLPERICAR